MANTIQIKRRTSGSGELGSLAVGELGVDLTDSNKLYVGSSSGNQLLNPTASGTLTSTGDFTIDSGDGIILDADGGSISLKDGGTRFGLLQNSSSNLVIRNDNNDKDILFKVKDDGDIKTALALDGSENGNATFSGTVTADGGTLTGSLYFTDTNTRLHEGDNNSLRITTDSGYLDAGCQNTAFAHFYTDRNQFYFNKQLNCMGHVFSSSNNLHYSGLSTNRWANVYSVAGDFSGNLTVSGSCTFAALSGTTATFSGTVTASGGTLSGTLNIGNTADEKIVLKNSNNPYVMFQQGTTNKGYIQWNAAYAFLEIANSAESTNLRLDDTLQLSLDGGSYYDVLTSNTGLLKTGGTLSGNLGINTGSTTPAQKLHIKDGGILMTDENDGQPMFQARNYATSATGSFNGNYGFEYRHATSTVNHAALIHLHENNSARKILTVSSAFGTVAEFTSNGTCTLSTPTISGTATVNNNLTVAGSCTFAALSGTTANFSGNLTLSKATPKIVLTNTTADPDKTWDILANGTSFYVTEAGVADRLVIAAGGATTLTGNLTVSNNATLNSRLTFSYNSHYFEAGTNSVAFKNSSGTSYLSVNNTGTTVTGTLQVTPAASEQGITIGDASKGEVPLIFKGSGGSTSIGQNGAGFFISENNAGNLDNNPRFVIDTDGRIGCGTHNPSAWHDYGDQLVLNFPGHGGMTIATEDTSSQTNIHFSDGSSSTASYKGYISYDHNLDKLSLGADAATIAILSNAALYPNGSRTLGTSASRWSTIYGAAGDFSGNVTVSGSCTFAALSGTTANFSGNVTVGGDATIGSAATKLKTYSDLTFSGIYNGSSLVSDEAIYFGNDNIYFYNGGSQSLQIDPNLRLQLKATDYQLRYTSGSHIWYNRLTSGGTFAIHKNGVGDYLTVSSAGTVTVNNNLTVAGSCTFAALSGTTANFSGNVTAGGTLTIDGTIASTSDIILDSADGIVLDAGGDTISLKDDGVRFGILQNSSSNFVIQNPLDDKDIIFKVKDNGTVKTALTLDGSENGNATFSGNLSVGGNGVVKQIGSNAYATADLNNWYTGGTATLGQFYRYDSTHGHFQDAAGNVASNAPNTLTQSPIQIYSYGALLTLDSNSSFRSQFYMAHSASEIYYRSGWGTSSDQNWTRLVGDRNIQSVINNVGNISIGGAPSAAGKLTIHTGTNTNGLLIYEDTDDSLTHNLYIDGNDQGVMDLRNNSNAIKVQLHSGGHSFFTGGSLGIGTTQPLSKFTVLGSQGHWRVDPDSVSNEIQVLATTPANDGFRTYRLRTNETIFDTGGSERLKIASDGDVDILNRLGVGGAHSGSYGLYVHGTSYFSGAAEFDGGIKDKDGGLGTNGHVLHTNGSDVYWAAASGYSLPTASATTKGGIKIDGSDFTVNSSTAVMTLHSTVTKRYATYVQMDSSLSDHHFTINHGLGSQDVIVQVRRYAGSGSTRAERFTNKEGTHLDIGYDVEVCSCDVNGTISSNHVSLDFKEYMDNEGTDNEYLYVSIIG